MQSEDFYNPDFDLIFQKLTPWFLRESDIFINSLRGDFLYGNSDDQDIDLILIAKKGQFFWEPLLGYYAGRLQNGKISKVSEAVKLTTELRKDGFNQIKNLLIGHTADPEFVSSVSELDRSTLPEDSLVINVNANRV